MNRNQNRSAPKSAIGTGQRDNAFDFFEHYQLITLLLLIQPSRDDELPNAIASRPASQPQSFKFEPLLR